MGLTWNPEYFATQQGGGMLLFTFIDMVAYEERPEEGEDGAVQMSWERAHQAEGSGSAKTPRMECP